MTLQVTKDKHKKAFQAAFPYTLPILAGFLFLGLTYGLFASQLGFSAWYPFFMSFVIFAGSAEFLVTNLLLQPFQPLNAFLLILMVNARHLFYGLSMLERFKKVGKKKIYLIYALCDETFSVNAAAKVPEGVDDGWFMFYVTLCNQLYWVVGATLGGLLGGVVTLKIEGLSFVMTALFLVLFLERYFHDTDHFSHFAGLIVAGFCLFIFGSQYFIPPTMLILLLLLLLKKEKEPIAS